MQSYTVIIGILEMREKHFSYRDIRSRYGIGQGTVKLIIDRANELGLPLADIRKRSKQPSIRRKTSEERKSRCRTIS